MGARKARINPNKLTRHHRKPRRLGGGNEKENIIMIRRDEHEAWHTLFNHMQAYQICTIINYWGILQPYTVHICDKNSGKQFNCFPDCSLREITPKQRQAWDLLWGKLEAIAIIYDINTRFIDPDFELILS